MANIHMTLQGKGGVGKSLIASMVAQYKGQNDGLGLCVDTDPVNTSFHGFKGLNVRCLDIIENNQINPVRFDGLIEWISTAEKDMVIDNGASVFVPLAHYLIGSEVADLISNLNHQLVIHTVLVGGHAFPDTLNGFSHLVGQFPKSTQFVVWLNEYFGKVEYDGMGFEDMKSYKENKGRVHAIITWPELQKETFGHDLNNMLKERLTFQEALSCDKRGIMTKQRLKIVRDKVFKQLKAACL